MTTTHLTTNEMSDTSVSQPAPDLLTDLLDPILTHTVRHWWQAQHQKLSTPKDSLPIIPHVPDHLLNVVPQALAPSVILAVLTPFVTKPSMWTVPAPPTADEASARGSVAMLNAMLKLQELGRLPQPRDTGDNEVGQVEEDAQSTDPEVSLDQDDGGEGETEDVNEQQDEDDVGEGEYYSDEYETDEPPQAEPPRSLLPPSKCPFQYTHCAINSASANGHVAILDWWLRLHRQNPKLYPLQYTEYALDTASWHGLMPVLDWWFNSGLELRYSWSALADASEAGHVDVLAWWLRAEQAGKVVRNVNARVLDRASLENHVAVLDWWMDKGQLPLMQGTYSLQVIGMAAARGHVQVLKWWKARIDGGQVEEFMWDVVEVIRKAGRFGRVEVLEWLFEEGMVTEEVKEELCAGCWAEWMEWKSQVKGWWKAKFGKWGEWVLHGHWS